MVCGIERFFQPGYAHNLVQVWIPSLTGMTERLQRGAIAADIACRSESSTLVMARAFPNSQFIGFDYHGSSIERARELAAEQGLLNAQFEVAAAQDLPQVDDQPYDFLAIFDALHDMGHPRAAAPQIRRRILADGAWMIVEPAAGDRLKENLNAVSRVFYSTSASICVHTAMSQNGGEALGAQAGPAAIADAVTSGGFTRFRVATRIPFNLVIEAKP